MTLRNRLFVLVLFAGLVLSLAISGTAQKKPAANPPKAEAAQKAPAKAAGHAAADKFMTIPGLPTCATGVVRNGDPTKEASYIYAKVAAGCSIPWHWHTPNENVMIVSGVATAQMKDEQPRTLRAGDYIQMASKHVHQFRCAGACSLFIYSDAAFDIHYVDAQGKEISPDEALKAVKETAAKEMK